MGSPENAANGTVRVEVVNHADMYVKPRFVRRSTMHTYVIDPDGVAGPKMVPATSYEPDRVRTVFRVYDSAVALTIDAPLATPDPNGVVGTAPQGLLLPASLNTPYEFFGPDALILNSVSGGGSKATDRQVANPAVGTEWSVTVPAGQTWELESVFFTFTTSATVASRSPSLIIDDGVNELFFYNTNGSIAASLSQGYSFANGNIDTAVRATVVPAPLPRMTLQSGWRIRTQTQAIQAGDQYSAISIGYIANGINMPARVTVLREYC